MADNAQLQQVRETTSEVVNSSRETNQTVVGSLIPLQVSYLKLAQSLFLNWIELLIPQWGQPTQKQQEAFQRLRAAPMQP